LETILIEIAVYDITTIRTVHIVESENQYMKAPFYHFNDMHGYNQKRYIIAMQQLHTSVSFELIKLE
jgi:hypothetical protein